MEGGGYAVLLRYLLDFDLSGIDINQAPATEGLLEQKVSSLEGFHQWWLDCLTEGYLVGSDLGEEWPEEVSKERLRQAYRRYVQNRQIRSRIPEDRFLGKLFHQCLPSLDSGAKRRVEGNYLNLYRIPPLAQARREWEAFIGHVMKWDEERSEAHG
jgi:hypothetical protein